MKDMNFVDIGDIRTNLINSIKVFNHVVMERDQLYAVLTYLMINMGSNSFDVETDELKELMKDFHVVFLPGENESTLRVELIKYEE